MAYTIQDCVTEARGIVQDIDNTAYRVSDADAVIYANSALNTIALHRPDLFSIIGTIALTAGTTLQTAPAGALRLMEIFNVVGGRVVKECSQDDLDSYDNNWHNETAAATTNWVRHPRDPLKFFVSPPPDAPTAAVGLRGQYATPVAAALALGSAIPLSDAYKPVITEYIVWRMESRDDEFVSTPRAMLFFESWKSNLGVSAKTKATADSDVGNRDMQRQLAANTQQGGGGQAQSSQGAAMAAANNAL